VGLGLEEGDVHALARASLPALQRLSLARNVPLDSRAVHHLLAAPWVGRLRALDLADCRGVFVGPWPGLNHLEELGLAGNPRLRAVERLDLSYNPLNALAAVEPLLAADLPGLRRLDLTGCGLPASAVRALRACPRMQELDELALWGNPGLALLDNLTAVLAADPARWYLISVWGERVQPVTTRLS